MFSKFYKSLTRISKADVFFWFFFFFLVWLFLFFIFLPLSTWIQFRLLNFLSVSCSIWLKNHPCPNINIGNIFSSSLHPERFHLGHCKSYAAGKVLRRLCFKSVYSISRLLFVEFSSGVSICFTLQDLFSLVAQYLPWMCSLVVIQLFGLVW